MPRVYFDNLANAVTRDDVEEYFSRAGKVRGVLVVTDKASGKSRGFGCVDMEKLDDALHAIKWLNHADLKGKRRLVLSITLLQRSVAVEIDSEAVSVVHAVQSARA